MLPAARDGPIERRSLLLGASRAETTMGEDDRVNDTVNGGLVELTDTNESVDRHPF